ncbi:PilZ domain-containing protein [Pseudoduganella danionis]|uniref:PilZ domain-containing protein n=1 Tax=Pseudoduganella danionis TaxID=1890295 RepID=UPI00353080BB
MPRKILRAKVMVAMDGMPPYQGRTIDICPQGLSLHFDHKLNPGQTGQMMYEIFIDGKAQVLTCRCKVSHCIFSGDQFKIGFQFVNPDAAVTAAIAKYMR